jgi:hypothetical protein
MIIVELSGGLGNQMFQYALARVMSLKNDDEYAFDLSGYTDQKNGDTQRDYELDVFTIEAIECSTHDKIKLGDENPIIQSINRILGTRLNANPSSLVKEEGHFFHPEVLARTGDLYLRGFWQTEKYFNNYEEAIRQDFTFKKRMSPKSKTILSKILVQNSVSVHIRRGDYVSNPVTNKYHGTCSPAYYQKASSVIAKKVVNPTFYVFSDDPAWCKKNIKLAGKTIFVTHNSGKRSWEDMFLMSRCQHHIIANSSFSWWGAWLNTNPDKIVIAPKKWVGGQISMPDIIPADWISI